VTLSYNAGAADKSLRLYQQKIEAGQLPLQDLYHLSIEAAMGKMISVSFYFGEINLASFERKFGLKLERAFPDGIEFVVQRGLMEYTTNTLRLTPYGAQNTNGVIALFYAPAVKEHLLKLTRSEQVNSMPGWHKVGQLEYAALKPATT
jgi:oxygen-independent coproporphyrinogen-3 oxidase